MSTHTTHTSSAVPPVLDDRAVPADDLLGAGARAVIDAALGVAGAAAERSRAAQTAYHPGRSLAVHHEVRVRWPDGTRTDESVVLSAGRRPPRDAMTLNDGTHDVVAWRLPHDPWLPGLAPALHQAAAGELLGRVGLRAPTVRCTLRAYRPGRRAVVEVVGPGVRAFLKVVPTRSVERLHRRHESLTGSVPVPASLGWSADHGIVVLQALPGRTLRQALLARLPVPGPGAVLDLLDRLPHPLGNPGAVKPDWRAHEFADLIGAVAPDLARRTLALADGIRPFERSVGAHPLVPVHGDLYEAQLLVDGGRITGLLDVDTFGLGRRVDDLATMIGHLSVLAVGSPRRVVIERYAARLIHRFDRAVDPAALRAAVAAVTLGLATGPFRVLEPHWHHHTEVRVALAERWLDSARRAGPDRST